MMFFPVISLSLVALCALLASFIKVSWIVGSFASFFSAQSVLLPLAGAFGGVAGGALFYGIRFLARLATSGFAGVISGKILAFHVPGFFAALSWSSRTCSSRSSRAGSALMHVLVPLTCMAIFGLHPVGSQAFAYTLYWLIPVTLYFVGNNFMSNNIFLSALSSTFVAHAVGSVIWLYTVSMSPAAWLALIPVVFVERVVCAVGMTVMYHAIAGVTARITARRARVSYMPKARHF